MYSDCNIRIERLQNGYTVRITDPEIVKKNNKRNESKDGCCTPWQDPQVTYTFDTKDKVAKFVIENIDKALPEDEYSSTFDKAAAAAEKETD